MSSIAEVILERALARGARAADVMIKAGESRGVVIDPAAGIRSTRTAEGGLALRVLTAGGASGFVSVCGPEPDPRLADRLVTAALESSRGTRAGFALPAGPAGDGRGLGLFDPRLHSATASDLEGILQEAAAEALSVDPRVRRLEGASIIAGSSEIRLANSTGWSGRYRQTLFHLSVGVVAESPGASCIHRQSRTARNLSAISPRLFGDQVARTAVVALDGSPPEPSRAPAVLAPGAATELLRALAPIAMTGPADSFVFSPRLTLIDDGRLPGGIATAPFDGEGVATRRTVVIDRGRRAASLHDLESGFAAGQESTGHGVRVSFRDPPRRMPTNLFIPPGPDEPMDLLPDIGRGFWIQSLRPTAAILSDPGAFAAIATGRCIRAGEPAEPFSGGLLLCRPREAMAKLAGVGNDLTFGCQAGAFGAPSLLFEEMELATPW